MKQLKIQILALVALLLSSVSAQGACNLTGYPVQLTSFGGVIYLALRPFPTATYYYIGVATDPSVIASVNQSITSPQSKIFVQTNLGVCPAISGSGQYFISTIGTIVTGR